MLIRREADCWEIVVPSKVNLFLEVVGRRLDGYHDLDTIMMGISLCDRLRFRATEGNAIELTVTPSLPNGFVPLSDDDRAWEIPTDSSNLVTRALDRLRGQLGIVNGMEVELIKGIPAQSGLGGGSADAAAAIVGGMLAWNRGFHPFVASDLASKLGSDINFFIEGCQSASRNASWLARCTGRGERVTPIPSSGILDLVVVHPPQGCSTKSVFRRLAETNEASSRAVDGEETLRMIGGLDRISVAKSLFNRLERPASAENPWIDRIKLLWKGDPRVLGSCMSGSGSSVFAVVDSASQSTELVESLQKSYPVRAYAVQTWQTPSIGEQLSTMNSR